MIPALFYKGLSTTTSRKSVIGFLTLFFCCIANMSFGQTYSYVGGTSSNIFPFATSASNMVQWLMLPSYFPTAPAGNITTIYVKPSTSATNATYTNLTVKMGTTALTTLTTGPWISGLTTVYTAPTTTFPTVTAGGWVAITLQTPFFYSGTSNFILEISQTAYTVGFNLTQDVSTGSGARLYGGVAASTGTQATGTVNFGFDMTSATCNGTPSVPTITTAPITTPGCGYTQTITATYPTATSGGISYQWEQAAAAAGPFSNVIGGSGATTLSYTTPAITTPTWYRIKAICAASSLSTPSTAYAVPVAMPSPGVISGSATFCPGSTLVYSVVNSTIPATYTWTLPAAWTGTSTTNSISALTSGSAGGTVSVTATGSCGTSTASTLSVGLGSSPLQPSVISGNTVVCAGATQNYSTPAVSGATAYNWTLPSGWSGTSTTNTISVTPTATGGNITVNATNNCGTSPVQTMAITTTTSPLTTGAIIGDTNVCANASRWYYVNKVPNAVNYTWTVPASWSGTSVTDSINVLTIANTGTITARANNGCPNPVASTKLITVLPTRTPSVTITTASTIICAGTTVTFTPVPVDGGAAPTYQWTRNGALTATTPTYTTSNLANNEQISVLMTSNYLCLSTPNAGSNSIRMIVNPSVTPGVNVNSTGQAISCSGTPIMFTANAFAAGTTPIYQWMRNSTPVGTNSQTYTLTTPTNGDSIYCKLTSNATCATQTNVTSNKVGLNVANTVAPNVVISANPGTNIFNGQTVTFTANPVNGGTTPAFQWIKNGQDIPGANTNTYTTNTLHNSDQINVRMISSNICASPTVATSNGLTISVPTGVNNVTANGSDITLAPNPNTGHFVITADWAATMNGKPVQVDIINTVGQSVYTNSTTANTGKWTLDVSLSQVPAGMYMLRLKAGDIQMVRKFEVNK